MNSRIAALTLAATTLCGADACIERRDTREPARAPEQSPQKLLEQTCTQALSAITDVTEDGENSFDCDSQVEFYVRAYEKLQKLPFDCGTPETRTVLAGRISKLRERLIWNHCIAYIALPNVPTPGEKHQADGGTAVKD